MSNNKQSSVELFIEQLEEKSWENASMNRIEICMNVEEYLALKNQAKAMHKEEIKDAYNQGYRDVERDVPNIPLIIGDISEYNNAEQYYNETYGGDNEQQ